MGKGIGSLRRALGVVFLALPAAMLILGETALKESLDGIAFLIYWLLCFLFTSAAMFIALWEIRAVRRQTRQETRALIEETFGRLEENQKKSDDF